MQANSDASVPSSSGAPASRCYFSCHVESEIARELDQALQRMHRTWLTFNFFVWENIMSPLQRAKVGAHTPV